MIKKDEIKKYFAGNTNTDFLKIVAVVTMLVDHIGRILFPGVLFFEVIGRLSFPLFAYCLAVGAFYSKDLKKYAWRLLFFAIISQPFYMLALDRPISYLNVIFTMLFGLLAIYGLKEKKYYLFALTIISSYFLPFDYGLSGILLMLIFYIFRDRLDILLITSFIWLSLYFIPFSDPDFYLGGLGLNIGGFAVLSLILIYFKTDFKVRINKYFFYIFYPAHLLLLYLIKLWLQ
ncbi:MAG: TraX family protein [Candidatus Falkowbacteria bacterium]